MWKRRHCFFLHEVWRCRALGCPETATALVLERTAGIHRYDKRRIRDAISVDDHCRRSQLFVETAEIKIIAPFGNLAVPKFKYADQRNSFRSTVT